MVTNTETSSRSVWQLDATHTLVEVSAKHMMVNTVKGRFKGVRGTIALSEVDPSRSSVEVEIDASTIDTGAGRRDSHLKSADFLEVEKYPTITFKSTRVEPLNDRHALVIGELSIRDVTRPVTLDTYFTGQARSPYGQEVAAFESTASINRKDFGLNWNVALEAGGFLVGDELKIELAVEAVKQP